MQLQDHESARVLVQQAVVVFMGPRFHEQALKFSLLDIMYALVPWMDRDVLASALFCARLALGREADLLERAVGQQQVGRAAALTVLSRV